MLTPGSLLVTMAVGWRMLTPVPPLVTWAQGPHVSALQGAFACPGAGTSPEPSSRGEGTLAVPTVPNPAFRWVGLRRDAAPVRSARVQPR